MHPSDILWELHPTRVRHRRYRRRRSRELAAEWGGRPDPGVRYVFHHLPKCGGSSMRNAMNKWFAMVPDYQRPWADRDYPGAWKRYKQNPPDLEKLQPWNMLVGHWHLHGIHPQERWPGILEDERYRLITFLRDPLQVRLSIYYYAQMFNRSEEGQSLDDELFAWNNYLAKALGVTEENWRDVLDRYFFVGVLEESERCFAALARLLDKPPVSVPWVNKAPRDNQKLSPQQIARFNEENALDYKLYEYARNRCIAEFGTATIVSP